jgi:hypothetical protein
LLFNYDFRKTASALSRKKNLPKYRLNMPFLSNKEEGKDAFKKYDFVMFYAFAAAN